MEDTKEKEKTYRQFPFGEVELDMAIEGHPYPPEIAFAMYLMKHMERDAA